MATTLALALPLLASAGWVGPSGEKLADTEDMRSAGNFGAQLVLTTKEKDLRYNWIVSTKVPILPSTSQVPAGKPVSALILFHGCKANKFGYCNVLVDYSLEYPDGTIKKIGQGAVWKGLPSNPGYLQLGTVSAKIIFDKTYLGGTYTVHAVVRDRVADAIIPLVNSRLLFAK